MNSGSVTKDLCLRFITPMLLLRNLWSFFKCICCLVGFVDVCMFVSTSRREHKKLVILILCFSFFSDHSVLGKKGFRRPYQSRGAYRSVHVILFLIWMEKNNVLRIWLWTERIDSILSGPSFLMFVFISTDGVVLVDSDYIKDRKVFGHVLAAFRYGREDLDVLGLTFRKDLYLASSQIFPHEPTNKRPPTRLQVSMLKLSQFWFAACVTEENERKDQMSTTDYLSNRSKLPMITYDHISHRIEAKKSC